MNWFLLFAFKKLYVNTFKSLPIGKLFNKLANLRDVEVQTIRKLEKLTCKLATLKLDLKFFNRCEELEIIPEFLKFKPPRLKAYDNASQYYRQALIEQRNTVTKELRMVKKEHREINSLLKQKLSSSQFGLLNFSIEQEVKKVVSTKEARLQNKLYKIWNKQKPNTPDCVINLSSKKLTLAERNGLLFGFGHHILPRSVDGVALKAHIDSQVRTICEINKVQLTYDNKTRIREATERFIHESEGICNGRRNRALHNTLLSLSTDAQIKCCKMDKGVGVVILNKEDYVSKLESIINDESRFEELSYDLSKATTVEHCSQAPWILRQNSIYRYINTNIKRMVDEKTYKKLLPTGSQPGRLYGMAKNHKQGCPLRPVLSAINTAEYALAKWFETQIKPLLNDRWSVSSSTCFVKELNSIKPCKDDVCVSFDIKSLYTNVPLQEVIDDVTKAIYHDDSNSIIKTKGKFSQRIFSNMLKSCSESIFLFNSKVYKQIDGLAMGSPLAPLLANWFVAKIENNILEDPSIKQPKFYRRYVDDIFAVFSCEDDRDAFFQHLNNAHQNLSFTMEKINTSTNSLPFLDVEISITESEEFSTKVYRKPTNTNVMMNFHATAPTKWKVSLLNWFLKRAMNLSSSKELFDEELITIKRVFGDNGYPKDFVTEHVNSFIKKQRETNAEVVAF